MITANYDAMFCNLQYRSFEWVDYFSIRPIDIELVESVRRERDDELSQFLPQKISHNVVT